MTSRSYWSNQIYIYIHEGFDGFDENSTQHNIYMDHCISLYFSSLCVFFVELVLSKVIVNLMKLVRQVDSWTIHASAFTLKYCSWEKSYWCVIFLLDKIRNIQLRSQMKYRNAVELRIAIIFFFNYVQIQNVSLPQLSLLWLQFQYMCAQSRSMALIVIGCVCVACLAFHQPILYRFESKRRPNYAAVCAIPIHGPKKRARSHLSSKHKITIAIKSVCWAG